MNQVILAGCDARQEPVFRAVLKQHAVSVVTCPCILSAADCVFASGGGALLVVSVERGEFDVADFLRLRSAEASSREVSVVGFGNSTSRLAELSELGIDDFLTLPMPSGEIAFHLSRAMSRHFTNSPDKSLPSESAKRELAEVVTGSFTAVALTDFVQMLVASGAHGMLQVEFPETRGAVYFSSGHAVHADVTGKVGEDAFLEILRLSQSGGGFEFRRVSAEVAERAVKQTIQKRTDHLLLALASVLDEMR